MRENSENDINDNSSQIFDYLEKHHGVFVSSISALVVVISFIFNAVIYAKTCGELQAWGIDARYVEVNVSNQIYILAGVCIYFFANIIFVRIMDATYEKYLLDMEIIIFTQCVIKEVKRQLRGYKVSKLKNKEKLSLCEKNEITKLKAEIKINRRVQREYKNIYNKKVIATFSIVAFFSIVISSSMLILLIPNIKVICAIGFATLYAITVLYLFPKVRFLRKKSKIKNKFKNEDINREETLMTIANHKKDDKSGYIMEKIANFKFREIFNDNGFESIIVMIVLMISILFLLLFAMDINVLKSDNELSITSYEGQEYVIVYENDKYFYLEEVEIKGSDIYINLAKQRVVKKEDITYEIVSFDIDNIHKEDWKSKK